MERKKDSVRLSVLSGFLLAVCVSGGFRLSSGKNVVNAAQASESAYIRVCVLCFSQAATRGSQFTIVYTT